MDERVCSHPLKLGDHNYSDVIICLRNEAGKPRFFPSHSFILKRNSNYFANKLCEPNSISQLDIHCTVEDCENYIQLLKRLYYPVDSLLDSWDSVRLAVGVVQTAFSLDCQEIVKSCIQYLEAVPWEDKEEELILEVVVKLGSVAMPIMARIQPVDANATKIVFIAAVRFATSANEPCLPFLDGNGLKTSAQEQIEYMLGDDDGMPLIAADDEVKLETGIGLSRIFSLFEKDLSSLLMESDITYGLSEKKILRTLSDLDWMCNVLPKMDMMKDFVVDWTYISGKIMEIIEDKKLDSFLWDLKVKLIEVMTKVLEAVGYGNVIVPANNRVSLVKSWLPYIRKMKPLLDSIDSKKLDEDLCQNIEGAFVSLILALPSNDQADIFMEWMDTEQVKYPDLSEAFEVWCYRTKSAKRRLVEGIEPVGNTTIC